MGKKWCCAVEVSNGSDRNGATMKGQSPTEKEGGRGPSFAASSVFLPHAMDSHPFDHFGRPLASVDFDPSDRRYRCCCGLSHATTGVRVITGGLFMTVLLEFWQLCWHFLSPNGSSHSLSASTGSSVVQLLFGLLIVSSVFVALWRESANMLLPYLLLQTIGLAAVFIIFLALFYLVLDNDVETIRTFLNSHGPVKAETTDNAELVYMGWTLCLSCVCLLVIQFWLVSTVFACWRYFRDKQIYCRGNAECIRRPNVTRDIEE